jgi:5-methylcytosine-specific restriction endonuclease McrA
MTTYQEKLKDPRWQRKRLEIFQRDNWKCTECGNDKLTLHVHHKEYEGEPWDAPDDKLKTICETCHAKKSDKILQIAKLLKALDLFYTIVPIYGNSDLCTIQ